VRYWTGGLIAFSLAIVQASSVEQFKVLGVSPNLLLVFLVAWLVVRGLEDVLPMLFVAGVTFGLVGLLSPGVVLLALLPVVALGLVREMHVVHSDLVLALLLAFAASLAYETVMLASVMATGGALDVRAGFEAAVVPAAIVNVALMLPVYAAMRFAKPAQGRGQLSF
jgi:cell shape-determining protein MreD